MKHKLFTVGFGILSMSAAVIIASGYQSTPVKSGTASRQTGKDSVGKTVQDLTDQVNELNAHIRLLETQQEELRSRLARLERPQFPALSDAASELTRFDCGDDQNRAWAMALSQRVPGYTLEGAAAMNCTQRLAKITEKVVLSIQNR